MRVSDKALNELKILLQQDYPDMDLSEETLRGIAINLLRTVKVVYGNLTLSDREN